MTLTSGIRKRIRIVLVILFVTTGSNSRATADTVVLRSPITETQKDDKTHGHRKTNHVVHMVLPHTVRNRERKGDSTVTTTKVMSMRESQCRDSMTEFDRAYRTWRAGSDLWYKLSQKTNRDLATSLKTHQYGRAGKDALQELRRARSNSMDLQFQLGTAENSLREHGNERTAGVMNDISAGVMTTNAAFFSYSLSRWKMITNIAHGRSVQDHSMATDPFHKGMAARDEAASLYRATLKGQSCVDPRR